jgi:hypothetical protein
MLLSVLALTAALGAHTSALPVAPVEAPPANAYVVDCQVSGEALTDCKVIDADPQTNARAATALKLAAEIHLPSGMAVTNPGRIKIRLNVNP